MNQLIIMMLMCMYRSIGYFPSQLLLYCIHCKQLRSSSVICCLLFWCHILHGVVGTLPCIHLPFGNRLQTASKVSIHLLLLITEVIRQHWMYEMVLLRSMKPAFVSPSVIWLYVQKQLNGSNSCLGLRVSTWDSWRPKEHCLVILPVQKD